MHTNLPLLTSILSIACIMSVGRKQWWGHLIGLANCLVFCVIAMRPGQWGYMPSNIICSLIYIHNALKWRNA